MNVIVVGGGPAGITAAVHAHRLGADVTLLDRNYMTGATPVGGFRDPEYASVGMTEAEARAHHDCVVGRQDYRRLTRAVVDGRDDGFCKLKAIGVVALHLAHELDLMPRSTAFESAELSEASA